MSGSSRTRSFVELREPARAVGPDVAEVHAGVAREVVQVIDADVGPGEPGSGTVVVFETDGVSFGSCSWCCDLDECPTVNAEQLRDASQQRGGRAADPDVAVEQECGTPPSVTGYTVEDRPVQHWRAALPGDGERRERDVDAETHDAGLGERERVTCRSAADVEDRTVDPPQ